MYVFLETTTRYHGDYSSKMFMICQFHCRRFLEYTECKYHYVPFDTISVSINAKPDKVWEFVADINNWPQFSDFARNIERVKDGEWVFHTSQGDVRVIEKFDREHLLLDTVCIVPSGDEQFIPYRVVPNGEGCELIMTNQQTGGRQ